MARGYVKCWYGRGDNEWSTVYPCENCEGFIDRAISNSFCVRWDHEMLVEHVISASIGLMLLIGVILVWRRVSMVARAGAVVALGSLYFWLAEFASKLRESFVEHTAIYGYAMFAVSLVVVLVSLLKNKSRNKSS